MSKNEISEMKNDDLQREYINIVLRNKLEMNVPKERGERTKILYNELRKRGILTKTIRTIRELDRKPL